MGRKLTTEEFKERALRIHNSLYTYENTVYTNMRTLVNITCPIHGNFTQMPPHHLKGKGCPHCGKVALEQYRRESKKTLADFVKEAKEIHGHKYDYTNTVYVNAKTNVAVVCPIHGTFTIRPSNHILGEQGCKQCTPKGYSDTEWELLGNSSKHFREFKLYVIKCWNDKETFYKIGKTFTTLQRRLEKIPYDWELVLTVSDTAKEVSKLERLLHKQNKSYIYTPLISFSGHTECFSKLS